LEEYNRGRRRKVQAEVAASRRRARLRGMGLFGFVDRMAALIDYKKFQLAFSTF